MKEISTGNIHRFSNNQNKRKGMNLLLTAIFLFAAIATSLLARVSSFDEAAFNAALSEGKTIVVAVHADWCPTCRKQEPIINEISGQAEFKNTLFYRVDFDTEKKFLKRFNVSSQSTLIVFKGRQEIARSTGETSKDKIKTLFLKGI
jgi:thiol:disulfide interchange protein